MGAPRHGGHLVAETLKGAGVSHLFTLSGGHIAPIYDGCVDEGIRIVDFRHEQAAAHAADAWTRLTGVLGYLPKHFEYVFELLYSQKRRPVLNPPGPVYPFARRNGEHHADRA
jgi:glyoxylate carboligase